MKQHAVMSKDVLLAIVLGAQGLKGGTKVKTFTEAPGKLGLYGPLHTRDGRKFRVASLRESKDLAIVQFEGVTTRSAAESLKGVELYVSRTVLPNPDEQEFYHADLIGLHAEDTEGRRIGKVVAIHNFGASDVVEIERDDSNGTVLIPFTREVVPTIDIENGRVVIATPEEVEAEARGSVE